MTTTSDHHESCPRCQNWIKSRSLGCPICGWRDMPETKPTWRNERYLTNTAIGLMIAITFICLALFLAAPGIGILFAILALAPTARTLLVLRQRQKRTMSTSTSTFILMYLGSISFAAAWIVTCFIVVAMTFFVCLFLECTGMVRLGFDSGGYFNSWSWVIGLVVISLIILSIVVIRARWRWDTQPPYIGKSEHDQFHK